MAATAHALAWQRKASAWLSARMAPVQVGAWRKVARRRLPGGWISGSPSLADQLG